MQSSFPSFALKWGYSAGLLIITGNLVTIFVISNIQVIDEADRMMDEISKDWISQVEKSAYPGKSAPFGVASLVQARPKPGPVTLAR